MKRRKVLLGLPLLIVGGLVSYPGLKWIHWNTTPHLDYLDQSKNLLAFLADTIIPKTDSPAASECGVHDFIIKMVKDCSDIITQNKFIEGLKDLTDYTRTEYGKEFYECSPEQRRQILSYFEKKDKPWPGLLGKAQNKYLGSPFFVTLKKYSAVGYFTSEIGATQALRYAHVPGKYIACEPYRSGEKGWATN